MYGQTDARKKKGLVSIAGVVVRMRYPFCIFYNKIPGKTEIMCTETYYNYSTENMYEMDKLISAESVERKYLLHTVLRC